MTNLTLGEQQMIDMVQQTVTLMAGGRTDLIPTPMGTWLAELYEAANATGSSVVPPFVGGTPGESDLSQVEVPTEYAGVLHADVSGISRDGQHACYATLDALFVVRDGLAVQVDVQTATAPRGDLPLELSFLTDGSTVRIHAVGAGVDIWASRIRLRP